METDPTDVWQVNLRGSAGVRQMDQGDFATCTGLNRASRSQIP